MKTQTEMLWPSGVPTPWKVRPGMVYVGLRTSAEHEILHPVPAFRWGDWAAHPTVGDRRDWTLTHYPTGRSVHTFLSQREACRAAETLDAAEFTFCEGSSLEETNALMGIVASACGEVPFPW